MQLPSREEIGAHYDRHEAHHAAGLPPANQALERERFIDRSLEWHRSEAERAVRHQRVAAAVFHHLDASSLPQADWPKRVREAAEQFQRIIDRAAHLDDVDLARAGMSALAGIWLTEAQVENVYVYGSVTGEVPAGPVA